MKKSIIITAGGVGQRMESDVPKQFIELRGRPILMYTIESFSKPGDFEIVLTLPAVEMDQWKQLCKKHQFTVEHQVTAGGESRSESVKNGLRLTTGELIGVHDGVRPFVSSEVIEKAYKSAEINGNGIPVLPLKQSIRKLSKGTSASVNRDDFKAVQTPQVFQRKQLLDAFEKYENKSHTDEASLVESAGYSIHLVDGNDENIKITTPFDLKIANLLLS